MPDLLIKDRGVRDGYVTIAAPRAGPGSSPLRWLEFGRLGLPRGASHAGETGGREAVFHIISGACRLEVEGGPVYDAVGDRGDPFAGDAAQICLPPSTSYCLTALSPAFDCAVSFAPAEPGLPVAVVRPGELPVQHVGAGNWSRRIHPGTSVAPVTRRIMMAETIVPPGNWTSYPPHKHDTSNPPGEEIYEEVYFYLFKPAGGYGIQRVYETTGAANALNEVYVVEDGDAVAIPRGYHPLVAAAGYQLCYIWALVGAERRYGAWSDDPAHAWIRGVEPILKG